jgi:hypothetical protein
MEIMCLSLPYINDICLLTNVNPSYKCHWCKVDWGRLTTKIVELITSSSSCNEFLGVWLTLCWMAYRCCREKNGQESWQRDLQLTVNAAIQDVILLLHWKASQLLGKHSQLLHPNWCVRTWRLLGTLWHSDIHYNHIPFAFWEFF